MICPCGCGELTPLQSNSVWHNSRPYWEWICVHQGCKQLQVPWRNQTGEPDCPWCGKRRVFIGHFQPGDTGPDWRVTVLGERVPRPTNKNEAMAALLFGGYGYPGGIVPTKDKQRA